MVSKGRQLAWQWCAEYRNWPKCRWKPGDAVRINMRIVIIPSRGEELSGSNFLHMVPVAKDVHTQALREVWQVTATQWRLAAQLAFDSATLVKCSSSSTPFPKRPLGGKSENVWLFGAVNGTGIVSSCSDFCSFFLALCLTCALHTLISSVWPV